MPTTVQIDGVGEVEFPDSMTPEQITQTIRTKILKTPSVTATETAKPPKQGLLASMAANTVPGVAGVRVPPANIEETLSKPFVKTEPLSNDEKLAFTQGLSSYLKAQGHPVIASLVEKNPEAVGAINEVDRQVVDFMDSPEGLLTLGVSGLGKVAQRALMAWFGGQAAIQAPETLKKITKAVKENDPYAASQGILELTTQAEMGLSGIKGVVPKSKAIQLGEEIQQASKDAQLPTLKSATPIVQPGEAKIPPEIVSTMEQARAREGALDEAQSQDIQAQQARQEQAKASKEIQVPETPPEPEREYSSVVEEVRQRGLDTKRKVQAVFPQLSREEASDLVKRAFPEGAQVKPTPPTKTVEPAPSQPPTQPKPETTVASPETPPQKTAAEPPLTPKDLADTTKDLGEAFGEESNIPRGIKQEPSAGIGIIPQPPKSLRNFAEQDVAPLVKKGVDAVKAAKNIIVETFSPTSKARSTDLDALMEAKGHKEQFSVQAAAAVEHAGDVTSKLDPQQQIEFFDRGKTGQPQATPELQQINDLLRKWDDRLYDEATVYRPDLNYLDNHMRVLWQVVPGSPAAQARLAGQGMAPSQIQSIMSKRPWQGSKGFLKRHALDDMSQGIALGGVPVTTDPVRMFLLHAEDVMKFVSANRAFERLKDLGAVEFVKRSEKPPEDYAKIDDRIADVYFKVPQGMVEAGKWWAQEDAARLINNYLSRDYVRGQGGFAPIGRALMGLKNGYTMVELGLSPFHAVFETIETVGSELGRAIARASTGNVIGAGKEFVKAATSPVGVAKEGGMGIRYAKDPAAFKAQYPEAYKYFTSKYPDFERMIKDLFTGGGTIKMWDDYRLKSAEGMKQAWAQDNPIGAAIRSVPWALNWLQKPLFELYIPRLKVGMFLRDYAFELERNADKLASGAITRDALARKTWAFVEDRFGEMNFDNLYWNRTFKSAMQLLFRSVTWKLGNLRGFGKAAVDTVKFGNDLAHGIKPTVTLPMGWALGLTMTTATLGTVISKAFSGKYPWEWSKDDDSLAKDLTYPHISSTDPSQRVSIPTYVRDLVGMRKGLVEYGRSSMTGLWGKMADDWQNRDFYGTEVRHPGDPIGEQAADLAKHLFPIPFSISSAVKAEETGATGTQSALGFAGFTKAPYSISHTSAEVKASELIQARMPKGARTREEFERSVQERRALESVKRGEMTVFDAVRSGLVTPQRGKEFEKKTVQTPLVNAIRHLPAKDSVEVYEEGNASEKAQIKTMVLMKIKRAWEARSITPDQYKDMVQRVNTP